MDFEKNASSLWKKKKRPHMLRAFLVVDIGAGVVGGVGDNGLHKTSPRDKADPKVGQVVCLITCPAHNSLKHNLSTCLSLFPA